MIDVQSAVSSVEAYPVRLENETIELENLTGRILADNIYATRIQPPFDRVAMDGIAIKFSSLDTKKYRLNGIQKAGHAALNLVDCSEAIEVMTGAPLPNGTDTVIPYERIKIDNGVAVIESDYEFIANQNIHFKGSDYSEGKLLLEAGTRITSPMIAVIASQGLTKAAVVTFPRIAVVSTGDELIEPGKACLDHQIWRSNPFAIKSELNSLGIPSEKIMLHHLEDNVEKMHEAFSLILKNCDVLIISGGVSMGKYDYVHSMFPDLGITKQFHKIKQKPGKPMLFGTTESGQVVFGLPGNPVSALICMRRYVIPALEKSMSLEKNEQYVILSEDVSFKKEFVLFKAVQVKSNSKGELIATPTKGNGSGDFSGLAKTTGFIQLSAETTLYAKGSVWPYFPWKGEHS